MRCLSCNCNLTDSESKRKHKKTGEYIDLCTKCFREVDELVHVEFVGLDLDEDEQSYCVDEENTNDPDNGWGSL